MTGTFRPGWRIACVAVLVALPLTACAAGYQAETSRERTTLTSVGGAKGDLTLRNVFFYGPASSGDSLPLYLSIFNGGGTNDKLVGISSPSASGGTVPTTNAIAGGGQLVYNQGNSAVPELTGIKGKVLVGQTVDVTLKFQVTGDVTLTVPVEGPVATPTVPASS